MPPQNTLIHTSPGATSWSSDHRTRPTTETVDAIARVRTRRHHLHLDNSETPIGEATASFCAPAEGRCSEGSPLSGQLRRIAYAGKTRPRRLFSPPARSSCRMRRSHQSGPTAGERAGDFRSAAAAAASHGWQARHAGTRTPEEMPREDSLRCSDGGSCTARGSAQRR
ncbi:hypothetical protein K458DRAFT_95107 [Lentithecium fluviatile CBS 122367]|uniref:Uncharacterized protein n=1 Tax=Lentithecium fluviatile CBS 122367 TaxID=1168545 RepID=A0A6G1IQB2_9PLEO|nr:hypothetical protein K458DRAFT_95107 [Lentithecium fluviatile CBS 122367]